MAKTKESLKEKVSMQKQWYQFVKLWLKSKIW